MALLLLNPRWMNVETDLPEGQLKLLARDIMGNNQFEPIDEVADRLQVSQLSRLGALQTLGQDLGPMHQEVLVILNDGCSGLF